MPYVRDDRDTPCGGLGWREFVEMICPTGEAKYLGVEFAMSAPEGKTDVPREPGHARCLT
jgi:hypothetical protein